MVHGNWLLTCSILCVTSGCADLEEGQGGTGIDTATTKADEPDSIGPPTGISATRGTGSASQGSNSNTTSGATSSDSQSSDPGTTEPPTTTAPGTGDPTSDSSTTDDSGPMSCINDDLEPNDDLENNEAEPAGSNDCTFGDDIRFDGQLNAASQHDWYATEVRWNCFGPGLDPVITVSVPGVQVCSFPICNPGSPPAVRGMCRNGGEPATSPGGSPGCCGSDEVTLIVDCVHSFDESHDLFTRVSAEVGKNCVDYVGDISFTAE